MGMVWNGATGRYEPEEQAMQGSTNTVGINKPQRASWFGWNNMSTPDAQLTPEQLAYRQQAQSQFNADGTPKDYQTLATMPVSPAFNGIQGTPQTPIPIQQPAQGGAGTAPFTGGSSIGLNAPYGATGTNSSTGTSSTGTNYTPPAYDPNSATAQNPFLNIGLNAYTQTQQPYNPGYLNDVSKSLWNQATTNLNENVFPGMDSNAIQAGGYGGDRSYLAKGVAADRMNQSVFNAMAPQYQQDYNAWQNRALAGGQGAAGVGQGLEGLGLQQTLGLGNLGVSQYSADTQRQLGLANANTGQYQADTQRQLGLSDMDIKRYMAESENAARAAQNANPQYTNPWAAGIGGFGTLAQLWNTLFPSSTTTPSK